MSMIKEPDAEPISGYKLVERLGSGGFGEVWKCIAPGGIFKAIKFVYGDSNNITGIGARANEEFCAIEHIKSIRHPFLLSIDRVESHGGELMIVTELADQSLNDVLVQHQQQGRLGIPHDELIGYLREVAEILDVMNQECALQHLDIKPRNIFLVRNHVKVADFGLVNPHNSGPANDCMSTVQLKAITPLYASPEVFQGKISRNSDQYSLAVVYQELLTGSFPFTGANPRQVLLQQMQQAPNLEPLPELVREPVGRALSKDFSQRFPSCMEFVNALVCDDSWTSQTSNAADDSKPETLNPTAETQKQSQTNDTACTPSSCKFGPEFLPGHRFVKSIRHSPLKDVWSVQDCHGRERQVTLIYGIDGDTKNRTEVTQRLQSLDHPGLLHAEIVRSEPGRIVMLANRAKESLRHRFQQFRQRKMPGIVREELMEYLRGAAESLDFLYQQHSIQHLGLHPQNLVLDRGWLQMMEFGYAQLLWMPAKQNIAEHNARYAAPELWCDQPHRNSDQFSLAVIYAEMLSGVHPFGGTTKEATKKEPNLQSLPPQEREIIAKALHPDPQQRWNSATNMMMALEGSIDSHQQQDVDRFVSLVSESNHLTKKPSVTETSENLHEKIRDLIYDVGGDVLEELHGTPDWCDEENSLKYEIMAGLPLGSGRVKLDEWGKQWFASEYREWDNFLAFRVNMPKNIWQRWLGQQPGLEVETALHRAHPLSPTPIRVTIQIRSVGCSEKQGRQLLQEMGSAMLESAQSILRVNSEKRTQNRILWPHSLQIVPVSCDGIAQEPIECRGKDLSLHGMGFYLPEELDTTDVVIHLPNTRHPPSISIPATLVRAKRCADGWYEVGALFRLPAFRKPLAESCRSNEE